jgi:hypothetical protein
MYVFPRHIHICPSNRYQPPGIEPQDKTQNVRLIPATTSSAHLTTINRQASNTKNPKIDKNATKTKHNETIQNRCCHPGRRSRRRRLSDRNRAHLILARASAGHIRRGSGVSPSPRCPPQHLPSRLYWPAS